MAKLSDKQRWRMARRYAAGEKLAAIAADFGVTKTAVVNNARRRGLPPRQPKKARTYLSSMPADQKPAACEAAAPEPAGAAP